jgi:hypothetical protein
VNHDGDRTAAEHSGCAPLAAGGAHHRVAVDQIDGIAPCRDVDVALGDGPQRLGEFHWVVGEQELQADLLGDTENACTVSGGKQTPAMTTRIPPGAHCSTSSMTPGTPTASNTTAVAVA